LDSFIHYYIIRFVVFYDIDSDSDSIKSLLLGNVH